MLQGKTVVLGITGSIAAYKMANVASMLAKQHCDVQVIMTKNATQFITPLTFETLCNTRAWLIPLTAIFNIMLNTLLLQNVQTL